MRVALLLAVLSATMAGAAGLRCWLCGQYSDGVGSITPCANSSAARLASCTVDQHYCIKYVSELTTVRDCVPTCTEKEWWGTRTYCCDSDACNDVTRPLGGGGLAVVVLVLAAQ